MRQAFFAFSMLLGAGALSLVLFAPWNPWLPLLACVMGGVSERRSDQPAVVG